MAVLVRGSSSPCAAGQKTRVMQILAPHLHFDRAMETILSLGSSALTIFGSAFTLGTILLVGFVRVCSLSGLVSEEETRGTLREFLRNFS